MPLDQAGFPLASQVEDYTPPSAVEELLSSPEHLRRWLASKAPDAVVGECNWVYRCTIAHFLLETTGFALEVGTTTVHRGDCHCPLPQWAVTFIEIHDERDEGESPLRTAAHCLAILNRICPETPAYRGANR